MSDVYPIDFVRVYALEFEDDKAMPQPVPGRVLDAFTPLFMVGPPGFEPGTTPL